jgi:CheY-like chemotaxis protein
MRPVQLRCTYCGNRLPVPLNAYQQTALEMHGSLELHCKVCGCSTKWEATEAVASRFAEAAEAKPARVLVIDDDAGVLDVVQRALARDHYELDTATSGRQAVTMLARGDYDLVLSDIRMPDFNGKDLFEFLEQHLPEYQGRVIFLTGDTANPETMKFLDQVKAPYLLKPLDIRALQELVRETLPRP